MKPEPIHPARIAFNADGVPCAPDFGDVYHATAGALVQAEHVFLRGNGLPGRWAGRERFVVLETGFGLGNNFLATWAAWRADPQRCERLVFVSVEKHPLSQDDLRRALAASTLPELAAQLLDAWPLLTPNLHLRDFDAGRVQLLLAFGDVAHMLPELQLQADALYLDGFAPARNAAMWTPDVLKRLARLAAPGATAATWSVARSVCDGLTSNGFVVERVPGFAGRHEMTVARFAPRYTAPSPAAFRAPPVGPREALVLGGGLAGCAAAWALSLQGWTSTVLDRQPAPAMETSGNLAGLMHGIFNAPDSLHARWFRAAALHTHTWAAPAVAAGRVGGRLDGLLRLDAGLNDDTGLQAAQLACARVGLPAAYVQPLSRGDAIQTSGLPLPSGGWRYGQAGWLSPSDWCAELLARAGPLAGWRGDSAVARLRRIGAGWQALDGTGRVLAEAPVLVLAHALGARSVWPDGLAPLPLAAVRGQTTLWPGDAQPAVLPRLPLSGQGYALRLADGRLLLGATTQVNDADPALRTADHRHNLSRAVQLGVLGNGAEALDDAPLARLGGRVGWRATLPDRLPVIGPPVDALALANARAGRRRLDALRHQPRWHEAGHGLYVFSGLASRGLTSAALGARVLAAWISGAPFPVENSLRDALDPARFGPPG
ncbi:MAG: FAD-dependent 5-carboxymethylaminomethyl-2-thiouridine(34) oxidoreductase MnmC [Burkholderiales bacterium]